LTVLAVTPRCAHSNRSMNRPRIDLASIRGAAVSRAADLAISLLGEPNRAMSSRRELRFGRCGSLSVVIAGPKAGVWHDHETGAGGDLIGLIMRERNAGFREAAQYAEQFIGTASQDPVPTGRRSTESRSDPDIGDAARNSRCALEIWSQAHPIADTLAVRYLAARGFHELPPTVDGDVLRFHPSCPYRESRHPCLLSLLRDIVTDTPRSIQRTALSPDGKKIGRRTLGPKARAAIKLSPNADVDRRLTIGEGLETTLAGMMLGYAPAWALGDAGELAAFPVLFGVESITILVDHDRSGAGQQAALKCSARWTNDGKEVFRLVPRQAGADVNDLLKAAS
jgi:putative DNA primase/helicase